MDEIKEEIKNEAVEEGKIDKDVIDVMNDSDILNVLGDDKQLKRAVLNCFCEYLSEVKGLRTQVEELVNAITICSTDKLKAFFKELDANVQSEEKRIELHEKMAKSHQKSKKGAKKSANIHTFPKKDVK